MSLRVGLLGTAHVHAGMYAALLARHPDVTFVGYAEADPAYHLSAGRAFTRPETLLAEGLDAVIISSETAYHLDLARLAARAGASILCEKPVEISLERAQELRRVCDAAGVGFMTAFPMRFDPHLLDLRARLQRGEVGRVLALCGVNHSENPARVRPWFASRALAGGGASMDHSVHLTDLYRWLLGTEVQRVYAEVSADLLEQNSGEHAVDTTSLIQLDLEGGVFAGIDASWSRPDRYPRWGHLRLEVIGTQGSLDLDPLAETVTVFSAGPRPVRWENWGPDSEALMLDAFIQGVRTGLPPSVTWLDGYRALEVALACVRSSAAGQYVTLSQDGREVDTGGG